MGKHNIASVVKLRADAKTQAGEDRGRHDFVGFREVVLCADEADVHSDDAAAAAREWDVVVHLASRLNLGKPYNTKVIIGLIVVGGRARRILFVAWWDKDGHALAGSREENSVGI